MAGELTGYGRDQLLALIATQSDNLTATQARCTELLEELRLLRELRPLAMRLRDARSKHPEGSHLGAVLEEVLEFTVALNDFQPEARRAAHARPDPAASARARMQLR